MRIEIGVIARAQRASCWSFLVLAVFLGAARSAAAQTLTATVRGRVLDDEQTAVLSATVTLASTALQGVRTALPRRDGSYGFWQLPPGDYDISFEAPQFAPLRRHLHLALGAQVDVSVQLQSKPSSEAPRSAEPASSIPISPLLSTLGRDEIDRLANPRSVAAVALLAPGVTGRRGTDDVAIHGAAPQEALFAIDGVDVTDNVVGGAQNLFIEDAIAETAVATAAFNAEYGRTSGGIVSAVTRSGGNSFSGGYRATLSSPGWSAESPLDRCDPAVTLPSCVKAPARGDGIDAWHEASVGGYAVKDRLWFFAAGRIAETLDATTLASSQAANVETLSNQRGQIKVTAALAPRQTLTFDALTNLTTHRNHPPLAFTADPAAIGGQTLPNYDATARYEASVGKKVLVEAQLSSRTFERRDGDSVTGAIVDSPMLARTVKIDGSPVLYNAPYFDASDPEQRDSLQGSGSVTYLSTGRSGAHEIKGGYEFFRSRLVGGGSPSSTGYVFVTDYLTTNAGSAPALDASGRFIPLWVPGQSYLETWLPTRGAAMDVDTQSVFLQDHWAVTPRFSADIGLRYENVRTAAAGTVARLNARTPMPRFAAAYALDDRASQIVRATYGRYAGRIDPSFLAADSAVGNPNMWLGVYIGQVGQGRSFGAAFDPSNYLTLAGDFPSAVVTTDPNLSAPVATEVTVAYDVDLRARGSLEAAFVRRSWNGLIDDSIAIRNGASRVVRNGFDVGTFTNRVFFNDAAASREYDALDLLLRYRPEPRWTVGGAYTLQLRNEGNYSGADADAPGTATPLGDYPEALSPERYAPAGRLPSFQRHRARLWTAYDLALGRFGTLSLSGLLRAESGRTYSIAAADQPLTPIQLAALTAAGYSDRPPSQTLYFGARGSQEFPGYAVLDLALRYAVPAFTRATPWVKLDLYNALNNQTLVAWDTTVVPDARSAADAFGLPTGYRPAATFGKATSNADFPESVGGQAGGRTLRLEAGFRF